MYIAVNYLNAILNFMNFLSYTLSFLQDSPPSYRERQYQYL